MVFVMHREGITDEGRDGQDIEAYKSCTLSRTLRKGYSGSLQRRGSLAAFQRA